MGGNSLTVSRVRGCLHSLSKGPLEGARLNNLAHSYWLADAPVEAYLWACWATHPLAWGENNIDRKALFTLGNVLLDHGRFREAELVFTRLDSEEQDPQAKVARSLALEGQEQWAAASLHAEARFHLKSPPTGMVNGSQWMDWPSVDRLSVWDEQGFGDSIQFGAGCPGC